MQQQAGFYSDRCLGTFLGVAIGDALGAPFEKMTAHDIACVEGAGERYFEGSVNPDPFPDARNLRMGQWTDDTQLTLAVARGFLPDGRFNMDRIAHEHVLALDNAFGWGGTTRRAVTRLKEGVHWSESVEPSVNGRGGGNGVVMKIAPMGLFYSQFPEAYRYFGGPLTLGRMTHGHHSAVVAGAIHAHTIAKLASMKDADEFSPENFINELIVFAALMEKNGTDLAIKTAPALETARRVLLADPNCVIVPEKIADAFWTGREEAFTAWASLGLSYACFFRNMRSMKAMTEAVRCGGDTDSNASIVGSLLGALNGTKVFPRELIEGLEQSDEILGVARRFYESTRR